MNLNKQLKDISKHKAQNTPPNYIFCSCCFLLAIVFKLGKNHIFSLKNINTKFKI
jgi:predicted nucleic acid-binding Zn finger protein